MKLPLNVVKQRTQELLQKAGMNEQQASMVSQVFLRASSRGKTHHDISCLPERLEGLLDGRINPQPQWMLLHVNGAIEAWDGDNGLGELNGMYIAQRAVALAGHYGVGVCSIRNSNHILACAPYTEWMAEQGMLGYIVTRSSPTISNVVGAAPQSFAIQPQDDTMICFDACMAYTSIGELNERVKNGQTIPDYWGTDSNGKPTIYPDKVLNDGVRLPIGGHKGLGLGIFSELMTAILSDGQTIDEPQLKTGRLHMPSHTAMCIDMNAFLGESDWKGHVIVMMEQMKKRSVEFRFPGERSYRIEKDIEQSGIIEISDVVVEKLNTYCEAVGLELYTSC